MTAVFLQAEALTADGFEPFGEVIETLASDPLSINAGTSMKHADLARIECDGGRPCLSIYRAASQPLPLRVDLVERHPQGSQAFVPLDRGRMLIVVAPAGPVPEASSLRAFVSSGRQGINLRMGTWHHPLVALDRDGEFLVLDRSGPGENCDVVRFSEPVWVDLS